MKTAWGLILLALILISMENTLIADKITELQRRLDALENTNQPYVGDWQSFNPANFSYSSATRIAVANITPSDFFKIGDRVKIIQTTDKYFYIYDVGATYIDVFGGSAYSVANADIDAFYMSKVGSPEGMDGYLEYTPSISADVGTPSFSDVTAYVRLDGSLVTIILNVGINVDASAQALYIGLPFAINASNFTDVNYAIYAGSSVAGEYLLRMGIYPAISTVNFHISQYTYAPFDTTSFRFSAVANYVYKP